MINDVESSETAEAYICYLKEESVELALDNLNEREMK